MTQPLTLYRSAKDETGYRGRSGIYELISIDNQMRTMIHDSAAEHELESYVRSQGPSILEDGLRKATEGITTLEEVLRVTRGD